MMTACELKILTNSAGELVGVYSFGHFESNDFLQMIRDDDNVNCLVDGRYPSPYEVRHDFWVFEDIEKNEWAWSVRSCSEETPESKAVTYWMVD